MSIHPTAIIHPDAEIAGTASIGAHVCIEGPAKIGEDTVVRANAVIAGPVTIGEGNVIGHGAIIGTEPQDLRFDPATTSGVAIGNHNVIREYSTIHRGSKDGGFTTIGDHNFLMCGAHLGHDVSIGNHVIIANNTLLGGHVHVGDRAFIGGGSVFHQGIRIGRLVMAQGHGSSSKDVPPFTICTRLSRIAGLNTVGLRRAGLTLDQRNELKAAFRLIYQSGLNISQALDKARESEWGPDANEFFDFISAAKKRGVCALAASQDHPSSP